MFASAFINFLLKSLYKSIENDKKSNISKTMWLKLEALKYFFVI